MLENRLQKMETEIELLKDQIKKLEDLVEEHVAESIEKQVW